MKVKSNIGVDFDDVLIDSAESVIETLGLFFNETYSLSSLKTYNIADNLWIDKNIVNDAIDIMLTNEEFLLIRGVKEIIKWLSEFYNIHIITARPREYLSYVETILKRNNIDEYITAITLTNNKLDVYRYLNVETIIEDRKRYIDDAYHDGIVSLVYDRPWNQDIKNTALTQRVYNWSDIKDYFMIKLGE